VLNHGNAYASTPISVNHGDARVCTSTSVTVAIHCLSASLRRPISIAIRRFSFPGRSPNCCWRIIARIFYPGFGVRFSCSIDFFGNTRQRLFKPFGRSGYRRPLLCDSRLGATSQIVSQDCRLTSIRKTNTSEAWVGID